MQEATVRQMTFDQLKNRISQEKPFILADSRDIDSYDSSHIPSAIPVPADDVEHLADPYDRNMDIITYCNSFQCPASTLAAKKFMSMGFKNVWDYKGGIAEWEDQGSPVESNK